MPTPIAKTKSYLLSTDTNAGWIRTNTIADIDYMATTLSGSTDTVVINRINTEINATIPTSDPTVISTLLSVTGYCVNQPN